MNERREGNCALSRPAKPRPPFDLAIIGGGINGCGIARDAAGRGWSVFLCEKGDLASATSSAASKLIHGGLRYLEYYQFRLVREALLERETLWRIAPHIIWPLRFVLPHHKGLRPAWLLRLGLFLYDHLGARKLLPPTRTLRLRDDPAGAPLKPEFTLGFEYSDCWVEDSRLVVLNARDAADRGASIAPRTRLRRAASREDGVWVLTLKRRNHRGNQRDQRARARQRRRALGRRRAELGPPRATPRPRCGWSRAAISSSARLYAHDRCYIFQNADRRIFFAIPLRAGFHADRHDRSRLCPAIPAPSPPRTTRSTICARRRATISNRPSPETRSIWTYSGVRPLYDDGASEAQAATRDYVLKLDAPERRAGAAERLRRQDHDLSATGRIGAGAAGAASAAAAARPQGWTAKRAAARRRFPGAGLRGASRGAAGALSFSRRGSRAPAGARLWHAGSGNSGRREAQADLGSDLRRRPDRSRSALSRATRMGDDGRGHRLAAHQAGAAALEGRRSPRSTTI